MYIAIRDFFAELFGDLDWWMDKPFVKFQKWTFAAIWATPIILAVMLWLNTVDWGKANLLIAVALSPIILTISLRWKRLAIVMGIGTFVALLADSDAKTFDKSRGALTALEVMARIQFAILITLWLAAVVLGFIPWAAMPSAFWAIAVPGMVMVAYLEYRGYNHPWVRDLIIILGCSSIIVYFAYQFAVASAPQTIGGKYFDEQSGLPLVMMEEDGSRVFTDKVPSDCAKNPCFSPFTGKKLVPITPEVAAKQGLSKFVPAIDVSAGTKNAKASSKGVEGLEKSGSVTVLERIEVVVPKEGRTRSWPNRTQGTCLLPVYPSNLEDPPLQVVYHPMYDWHPLAEMAKLQSQANPAWSDVYFVGNGKGEVRMHLERRKTDQCI